MAFSLDPAHAFDAAVRKVAVSQLEDAIHVLKKQPGGIHEAIHDARKKFKRVRGLYRLVRPAAKAFARAENARIRDMALSLSADRDATAIIECVRYLRLNAADGETDMALARLEAALIVRRDAIALSQDELQKKVEAAIGVCLEAIAAVERQEFDSCKPEKAIAKAWKKQLDAAHVAVMAARADATVEHFHELRKEAQTYWVFSALVVPIWPTALKAKRSAAKSLAELIGQEHDLSVLLAFLDGAEGPDLPAEIIAACRQSALFQRNLLRRRAVKAARKVFDDEAEVEAAVIRSLWRLRTRHTED